MNGSEIKGKAVVSIHEGSKLGQIDEVLVNVDRMRVAALHMKSKHDAVIIPFEKVRTVGDDAVTVLDASAAQRSMPDFPDLAGLSQLTRLKVVDEDGTFLGVVSNVEIDPHTGSITELRAEKGGVLGIGRSVRTIDAGEVTSVGHDLLVIQGSGGAARTEAEDGFYLVRKRAS